MRDRPQSGRDFPSGDIVPMAKLGKKKTDCHCYRIRAFYLACRTTAEIVPQAVGQTAEIVAQPARQLEESVPQTAARIPWFHNVILLEKVKASTVREWYAQAAFEHGWSRNVLEMQIESRLHERQGKAVSNFARTLPPPQSDLAQALLKDPCQFEFLTLGDDAHEREIERGLLEHIRLFLLEMGAGFAFVGSQYPLEVDGKDYYLDLLFYHLRLRCFVVIDLKATEFQPEFIGKMNFYLAVMDDTLRHEHDAPSLGLLLCRKKQTLTVEYALRNVATPIGVAEFITDLAQRIEAELNATTARPETNDDQVQI